MNPVIESLRREISLLRKGNLTWRAHFRSCEYIRPIHQYIEHSQYPNYEDFLSDNQNLSTDFEEHDRECGEVESHANYFFERLLQSTAFVKRVQEAWEEYQSASRLNNVMYPNLNDLGRLSRDVAELLVNRTEALPDHYVYHRFWEDHRKKFEPVEDRFEFPEDKLIPQTLQKAASGLRETSERLEAALKAHRRLLCTEYDIPPAPITVEVGSSADAFILSRTPRP